MSIINSCFKELQEGFEELLNAEQHGQDVRLEKIFSCGVWQQFQTQ